MNKYVVERTLPNAGQLSARELQELAAKSCRVLRDLGPDIQWVESHVTDNKIYCHYLAPASEVIREHALRGGFPVDSIREVRSVIDPTTAG